MRVERVRLSRHTDLAKALDYIHPLACLHLRASDIG
jgi:hypothetical protein